MVIVYFKGYLSISDRRHLKEIFPTGKGYTISKDCSEVSCNIPCDLDKSIRLDEWLNQIRKDGRGTIEIL